MYADKPVALVVDDEHINILILEKLLGHFGIGTITAENGEKCLEICKGGKSFDYIFLDIKMPGINGLDTMRQLKTMFQRKGLFTPVICITGAAGDDREEIDAAGFTDLLAKPINVDALREIVFRYAPAGKEIYEDAEDTEDGDHIPEALRNIPGIDTEYGVMHCGSVSDFLAALRIFYGSIEEKSARMDECLKRGYIEDLEFSVHSLKSTSIAVGAKQISEMAKLLEKACTEHNIPLVYSLTPEFINKYRDMGDELKKIFTDEDDEKELLEISDRKLSDALATLKELIGAYDRKNADNLLDTMKCYDIPLRWKALFNSLREYLRKMDWAGARNLLDSFEVNKK